MMAMAQLGDGMVTEQMEVLGIKGTLGKQRRVGERPRCRRIIVFTIMHVFTATKRSLALTPPRPHTGRWRACTPVALIATTISALTSEGPPRPPRA